MQHIVQKTSWKVTALVGGTTLVVGGLAGAGIATATSGDSADNTACVAALDHADEAMSLYQGAFGDASSAIDAYLAHDYSSMDRHTSNINAAADEVEGVMFDYYSASDRCTGDHDG